MTLKDLREAYRSHKNKRPADLVAEAVEREIPGGRDALRLYREMDRADTEAVILVDALLDVMREEIAERYQVGGASGEYEYLSDAEHFADELVQHYECAYISDPTRDNERAMQLCRTIFRELINRSE